MAVALAPDRMSFGLWSDTVYSGIRRKTLFKTTTQHSGIRGILPGRFGTKNYEVKHSYRSFRAVYCGTRDLIVQVARMAFPFQFFDGSRDHCSTLSNGVHLAVTVLYTFRL